MSWPARLAWVATLACTPAAGPARAAAKAGAPKTETGPVLVSSIDLRGAGGCPGMRLGDIDGDGRLEMVVGQPVDQKTLDAYTPQRVSAVTAFDLRGNVPSCSRSSAPAAAT